MRGGKRETSSERKVHFFFFVSSLLLSRLFLETKKKKSESKLTRRLGAHAVEAHELPFDLLGVGPVAQVLQGEERVVELEVGGGGGCFAAARRLFALPLLVIVARDRFLFLFPLFFLLLFLYLFLLFFHFLLSFPFLLLFQWRKVTRALTRTVVARYGVSVTWHAQKAGWGSYYSGTWGLSSGACRGR